MAIHLPRVRELARRHRQLSIVLDHGARPDIAAGQWQPWAADVAALAHDAPNVVCKLSGLLTEAGSLAAPPPPGAVQRWAAHLLDTFGAQRLLWGSDWPVLELAADFARWRRDTQSLLAPLNESDREAVLGANARRIYQRAG